MKKASAFISMVLALSTICSTAVMASGVEGRSAMNPEDLYSTQIRYEDEQFRDDDFRSEAEKREIEQHHEEILRNELSREQIPEQDPREAEIKAREESLRRLHEEEITLNRAPDDDGIAVPQDVDPVGENHLKAYANDEEWNAADVWVEYNGSTDLVVHAYADDMTDITYQWSYTSFTSYDTTELDCTESVLHLDSVTEPRKYQCLVTDRFDNSIIVGFYLSIENHLTATANDTGRQSADVYVPYGETTNLYVTVNADNTTDITYTWYVIINDVWMSLEEESDTITTDSVKDYLYYECTATDRFGNSAWVYFYVYVDNRLTATANDTGRTYADVYVPYKESTILHVEVSALDETDMTYQWTVYPGGSWEDREKLSEEGADLHIEEVTGYARYECRVNDRFGSSSTIYFYVYVDNHLVATANDTNSTYLDISVSYGDPVDLHVNVTADDMTNLTYTWRVSGKNIYETLEEDGTDLHIDEVKESARYYCDVKDRFGTSISVSFYVYVENHFTAYAADYGNDYVTVNVPYGESTVLRVEVSADDMTDMTYNWINESSWAHIGDNTSELLVSNVTGTTRYYCDVSDRYGTVRTVNFTVNVENHLMPTINGTGLSYDRVFVNYGDPVDLHIDVAADDTTGITYAWEIYDGTTWKNLTEKGPDLHIDEVTKYSSYDCRVTDKYGTNAWVSCIVGVENHFTATANDTMDSYLTITVPYNGSATLSVKTSADDMDGITYTWRYYGDNGRSNLDTIDNVLLVDNLTYSINYECTVVDKYGTYKYVTFAIRIENHLTVSPDSINYQEVDPGASASMAVLVQADKMDDLTYQWYREVYNSSERYYTRIRIPGCNTASYTAQNILKSAYYYCEVTDCYGNTESCGFSIRVKNNLSVTASTPFIQTIPSGGTVTMGVSVSADDLTGISYQWYESIYREDGYYSSTRVPGVDKDTMTVSDVKEAKRYECEVMDRFGNTNGLYFYVCVDSYLYAERDGEYTEDVVIGSDTVLKVKVTADDMASVTYQWKVYENGGYNVIEGEVSDTLKLTTVKFSRTYQCVVSDKNGNVMVVYFYVRAVEAPPYVRGDVNNDGAVDSDDAIYLLRHTMNEVRYPINQSADMNGDGMIDSDDAIYLLRHTMNESRYPLH